MKLDIHPLDGLRIELRSGRALPDGYWSVYIDDRYAGIVGRDMYRTSRWEACRGNTRVASLKSRKAALLVLAAVHVARQR